MIWEKVKSLHNNLKQKEGGWSKTGEFDASKGWFDNFRKRFGLKSVKITGEAASADQEAADEFPNAIKKITEERMFAWTSF